ncbi:hypothetical protein Tco_0370422, partial [Tanacetum coccineum]
QAVAGEGSSAAHNKYYDSSDIDSNAILYSSSSDTTEESENEIDDADESDMDLSDDNLYRDDAAAGYRVFMHNKSTATPNSTYLSLTVTSSSLDFIQTLLDDTPSNELTDFMSHPVYTDAQTTLVVHNPEGNLELTSYISCASEVPLGTHVDVLATKTLLQEMFPDKNDYHLSSPPATKTSYPITYPQPNSLQAKAKKLMQNAKKNMRKINFKKAAVQVKVLKEIKKLLPTHIPNAIANYVRPRLNTSVLKVMKTNQINLFTQSSTSTDDLLDMDLKLKLLNQIHSNKTNETHTTHQQLYDTLYESITLNQDALDAQAAQSSFHKRSHDNHDPPNNREGENKKKRQKDISEPSSRSSSKEVQRTDLEGRAYNSRSRRCGIRMAKGDVSKPRSFKQHMLKSTKPDHCFYNNDYTYLLDLNTEEKYTTSITKHYAARYYKEGIEDRIPERWSKEVRRYHFEALNGIHHWEEDRIDFFKARMSDVTEGNVYSDLRIKSVVRIVVNKKWGYGFLTSIVFRRSDDKEYKFSYTDLPRLSVNNVEDMYLLQVQDKLHHLPLEFVKDFNNALIMFIKRNVIKNRVEDIQLRQSEVKKFCDGTLVKIQENLIDMLSKNKLGSGNKRLKGRDWTDYDVKSSKEMLKKIDKTLMHIE